MTTRSSSAKPRKRKKGRRLRCVTYPTVRFALRGRLHNISGCPHRKGNGAAAGAERSDHQSALMRGNMTAAHVHGYCDRQCPSLLRRTSWRRSSSRRGRVRPDPQAMETHLASIEFTIEGVVHPFLITSDNDVDHWAQACSAAQTRPPFNNPGRSNYHESEHLHSSRTPQAPLVHPGEPFQEAVPNNNPQAHAVPHKHGPWIRLPQLACAIVVLTCECRSVALGTQAILSEHLVAMAQASSRHPVFTRHDTGREDNACRGHPFTTNEPLKRSFVPI